jgi:membrane protease YdiL (CAAX protease family)
MMDRDSAPSGAPAGPGPIRPMALFLGLFWTFVATFLFFSVVALASSIRSASIEDPVVGGASEMIGYGLALFMILRFHTPNEGLREVVGLRRTAWALYPLGLLVGVALVLPATALYSIFAERFPTGTPDPLPQVYEAATIGKRVMIGVSLAVVAPLVEETMFRGALFLLMRKMAERVSLFVSFRGLIGVPATLDDAREPERRRSAPIEAVLGSALLFALVHIEWQRMLPILMMGLVFGAMRQASASILPSLLAHFAFNGMAFLAFALHREDDIPDAIVYGGVGVAAALLAAFFVVARGSAAVRAAREAEP